MKNSYVSGLQDGARVDDVFVVHGKSLGTKQDGAPFLRLKFSDKTGTIDGVKWDAGDSVYAAIKADDFINVRGLVSTYNGKLQVRIDSLRPCEDEVDLADFLPQSERDTDEMLAELYAIVKTIEQPHLRTLLDNLLRDRKFLALYSSAPAAMKIHHAWLGGLLEHSLSVARMCDLAASHYPGVSRDLLVTGAILHDVGKIEEFSWERTIKYSTTGHFLGHIVSGAMMVTDAAEAIDGFDPLLRLTLVHMIVSHHGEKELGSPKRPKTVESIILHYIDDLDAKLAIVRQAIGSTDAEDEKDLWTERHWVLDRPLFRGIIDG